MKDEEVLATEPTTTGLEFPMSGEGFTEPLRRPADPKPSLWSRVKEWLSGKGRRKARRPERRRRGRRPTPGVFLLLALSCFAIGRVIRPAEAVMAYDCETANPKSLIPVGLHEVNNCTIDSPYQEPDHVYADILSTALVASVRVARILVRLSETVVYCGAYGRSAGRTTTRWQETWQLNRKQMKNFLREGKTTLLLPTYKAGINYKLVVNSTGQANTKRYHGVYYSAGRSNYNGYGNCDAWQTFTAANGRWYKDSIGEVKFEVLVEEFYANVYNGKLELERHGLRLDFHDYHAEDDVAGTFGWERLPSNCSHDVIQLFHGKAELQKPTVHGALRDMLIINDSLQEHFGAFLLGKEVDVCGRLCRHTHQRKFVACISREDEGVVAPTHGDITLFDAQLADLQSAVSFNHITTVRKLINMGREIALQNCELERKTILMEQGNILSGDAVALIHRYGLGYKLIRRGDVAYVQKCTPVQVRPILNGKNCTQDLQVLALHNNRTYSYDSKRRTLEKLGLIIECDPLLPPMYYFDGQWLCGGPEVRPCQGPKTLGAIITNPRFLKNLTVESKPGHGMVNERQLQNYRRIAERSRAREIATGVMVDNLLTHKGASSRSNFGQPFDIMPVLPNFTWQDLISRSFWGTAFDILSAVMVLAAVISWITLCCRTGVKCADNCQRYGPGKACLEASCECCMHCHTICSRFWHGLLLSHTEDLAQVAADAQAGRGPSDLADRKREMRNRLAAQKKAAADLAAAEKKRDKKGKKRDLPEPEQPSALATPPEAGLLTTIGPNPTDHSGVKEWMEYFRSQEESILAKIAEQPTGSTPSYLRRQLRRLIEEEQDIREECMGHLKPEVPRMLSTKAYVTAAHLTEPITATGTRHKFTKAFGRGARALGRSLSNLSSQTHEPIRDANEFTTVVYNANEVGGSVKLKRKTPRDRNDQGVEIASAPTLSDVDEGSPSAAEGSRARPEAGDSADPTHRYKTVHLTPSSRQ